MSIKCTSWIWDHSQQTGSALLVMLALADFCDDDGICYPGVKRIAEKSRLTVRGCQKVLTGLEKEGEILREINSGLETGHGKTNRYHLIKYQVGVSHSSPLGVSHSSPKPSVEPSDLDSKLSIAPQNKLQFSEYQQLVKDTFNVDGGRVMNIYHMLQGTSKRIGYRDYNITPAVAPDELTGFKAWYAKQNPGVSIPLSPEKIQHWILEYRKHVTSTPKRMSLFEEAVEEQRARLAAMQGGQA